MRHAASGLLAAPGYRELPLQTLDATRVEALWHFRAAGPCRQCVLPDGRMDLVAHAIHGADGRIERVWLAIAGPADRWSVIAVRAGMSSFGVRFRIGWGGMCLAVAPAALRNQVLVGTPAQARLGPLARGLTSARTAAELQEALRSAAAVLAARAEPGPAHRRALQAIARLMPRGDADAAQPQQAPASARSLRRDVQQAAGLSARTLAGVLRFQRAVSLLNAGAAASLADLAGCAGYADQAHMTREFRRFGGFTPALPRPVPLLGSAAPDAAWPEASRPVPDRPAHLAKP